MRIFLFLLFSGIFFVASCSTTNGNQEPAFETDNPIVTLEMENGEKIYIELFPDIAPNTVANFVHLVQEGYYDGLIFHRVIPGFMIQGGCPQGTGRGHPGWSIAGEFFSNGFTNTLQHKRGVVSMARSLEPDSAGSQFFIVVADSPHLDGDYAAFGRVLQGMEEADRIVQVARDNNDRPWVEQRIARATVELNSWQQQQPETIDRED